MDWRHLGELLAAGNAVYGELKNLCVWAKDNAGMGSLYRSQHELVLVFKHGENPHRNNIQFGALGRYRTNVWHYPGNRFLWSIHLRGKSLGTPSDGKASRPGGGRDSRLFGSRGNCARSISRQRHTVIAAERTGRVCYGIEIDPRYVDTIVRRWQAFTGKVGSA